MTARSQNVILPVDFLEIKSTAKSRFLDLAMRNRVEKSIARSGFFRFNGRKSKGKNDHKIEVFLDLAVKFLCIKFTARSRKAILPVDFCSLKSTAKSYFLILPVNKNPKKYTFKIINQKQIRKVVDLCF